jgi:hypothetical protein
MPDIIIPITDQQQAKLTATLAAINENRAAQVPPLPPLTQEQWAKQALQDDVQQGETEAASLHFHRVIVAYQNATPQQRQAARAALGL